MFLNIECRGGYWRNSTFCEKIKFLSKQYRLRKKNEQKTKKFLHLTNQVKTEENWDFFAFNRICEAWEQVLIFLEKQTATEGDSIWMKKSQNSHFFQKSGKNDKKFHFVTARTLFKKFKMLILGPILKNLGNSRPLKSGP